MEYRRTKHRGIRPDEEYSEAAAISLPLHNDLGEGRFLGVLVSFFNAGGDTYSTGNVLRPRPSLTEPRRMHEAFDSSVT